MLQFLSLLRYHEKLMLDVSIHGDFYFLNKC